MNFQIFLLKQLGKKMKKNENSKRYIHTYFKNNGMLRDIRKINNNNT